MSSVTFEGAQDKWGIDIEVKKDVITETPAITLVGSDYNSEGEDCPIFFSDLRSAEIGQKWSARCGNSWRDAIQESATLVYRDAQIAVLAICIRRAADSPNGERTEKTILKGFILGESATL